MKYDENGEITGSRVKSTSFSDLKTRFQHLQTFLLTFFVKPVSHPSLYKSIDVYPSLSLSSFKHSSLTLEVLQLETTRRN